MPSYSLFLGVVEHRADDPLPAAVFVHVLGELLVGLDLVAERSRVLEQAMASLRGICLHPAREQPRPGVLHRRVGILLAVMSSPRARAASIFLDDLLDPAEVVLAAHLDVIDVHRDSGHFGDVDSFVELFVDLTAFAADMRAVIAAVAGDHLRHRNHLIFVFVTAAGERSRQIDRAFLHGLRHQLRHLLDLGRRRRPILETDHDAPHLLRRDARRNVDRDALSCRGD